MIGPWTAGALGVVVALVALASTSSAGSRVVSSPARCAQGSVQAAIAGKRVCLRRGQRCVKRVDRQYHRYRFHCHNGRLTGGPRPTPEPAPLPPAGSVVATVPVPSSGGIAIAAGSVWVASLATHSVVRVDPASNRVLATIPVGDPTTDLLHGPTRIDYGHGSLWVLDGSADCSCVHRIDPATSRVVATIPLGSSPTQGRVAPLGLVVRPEAVWVALRHGNEFALDGAVVRVDPLRNEVVAVVATGTNPEFGGPTRIAEASGSVWASVPSMKSVVRIDPASDAIVATVPGLACGEGDLAADESGGIWIADCTAVRRIDPDTNTFSANVSIPTEPLAAGARGITVGFGSVWVQADSLFRLDPATGGITGRLAVEPVYGWEYSLAVGFGSVWVRQTNSVMRIDP